ncbi:DUF4139 domain-containing protein [Falsiroseomonas tokyonensis]|uniref:DUF4139 domain-containing protein n=1 Tax=Falsiroseomonas tokyonensis TaxID=430521 RepID=A0ABV7BRK4_9PROT|nr:DUF4139 domain-containing protein [Falsiroseomonas tokyonensis]MBU8537276.1 hypothetical protein [Falsiroseomonas tokyonensis]
MTARRAFATLLLATTALTAQAAELPVRGVTLSSAGLAQIERAGPVAAADPALTFRVPLADVDDILRSLVVADPAGRVEGLRLPAQDLAAEAFRGLPARPEDFASRATLLNALRGQRVAVGETEGRIAEASESKDGLRLTLLSATGLRSIELREAQEVRLLDEALAARLARAAEALAETRSADTRQLSVALRAGAAAGREVSLTYVAGAPLWKPSWRLAVPEFGAAGEARLMGWAVVENHTGSDWDGIRLSLVSSEAAAFRQALYSPVLLPRPELPILGSGQVEVRADTGGRPVPPPPPVAQAPFAPPGAMARMAAPAPVMEAAPAAAEATAAASLGRVAFTLADPVTIRSGQTANVPFLDARLPAERVWWVQGLGGRHPLQAVRLRNTTPHALPGGLATVYGSGGAESGGFLGDAELRGLPTGESRILAFARDQGVQYSVAQRGTSVPIAVALRRGAVQVTQQLVHTVTLAVDPGTARGTLVLDLPARRGETPRFTPVAEGDFGQRVEARLEGSPTNLEWAWQRETTQQIPLWDTALAEPLPPAWRDLSLDRDIARLPGGTDRLEALRTLLERLPATAPGRAELAALVEDFGAARRALDTFRTAARAHAADEAALARARRAYEDRTGPEREAARTALNAASLAAGRSGAEADRAWTAWRGLAQRVVTRGGG